jgi:hypothetical protein
MADTTIAEDFHELVEDVRDLAQKLAEAVMALPESDKKATILRLAEQVAKLAEGLEAGEDAAVEP